MSTVLTSNKLIKSIKRRAMIPTDQSTFEDSDFLEMLNEEIQYFGVQHLLSTYEEYLVTYLDFPLEVDKTEYEIPSRAVGNKLRGLFFVDSSNNLFDLSRIELKDLPSYTNNNFVNGFSSVFYIQGNKIVLVDEVPFTEGSLRMYFYLKPNNLVEEKRAATISEIDRTTGEITLKNIPDGFSNLPPMDFVQVNSPNRVLLFDRTPTSINTSAKILTFDVDDIPSELVVGDYVNFACECIVPQLPSELHPVLSQRVAVAALEALGDIEGKNSAEVRLAAMEQSTLRIIDNRVETAVEKVRNRNSPLQETTLTRSGVGRKGRF